MDKKLDIDAVIAEVRRVAAEQPDKYLDDDCVYFKRLDGTSEIVPVCLIGQGIAPQLTQEEREEIQASLMNAETVNGHFRIYFPENVNDLKLLWLREAQFFQDNDGSWGGAVEVADLEFPLN